MSDENPPTPEGDQKPEGGKQQDPPKSDFTAITSQADLDRIVGQRLSREREKFADYDELREKAAELEKVRDAAKSEQERAVERAKAEGRNEALGTVNKRLIESEARVLASEAKFRNPGLAVRAIDLASVKVGDDGTVDAAAIRDALKALSDAEPYLLDVAATPRKPGSLKSGASAPKGGETGKSRAAAALRDMRRGS